MLYVKKIDYKHKTTQILGIYNDDEIHLAEKLAQELKEADDNTIGCTWVFMTDNSYENELSYEGYTEDLCRQLVEDGEITQADYDYLASINFNFFEDEPGNQVAKNTPKT